MEAHLNSVKVIMVTVRCIDLVEWVLGILWKVWRLDQSWLNKQCL